jgi:hypothetical protein
VTDEDIIQAVEDARLRYHAALAMAFDAFPEHRAGRACWVCWRPKPGKENPYRAYIPMSWSATLIDMAGGLRSLFKWWEPEA